MISADVDYGLGQCRQPEGMLSLGIEALKKFAPSFLISDAVVFAPIDSHLQIRILVINKPQGFHSGSSRVSASSCLASTGYRERLCITGEKLHRLGARDKSAAKYRRLPRRIPGQSGLFQKH